MVLQRGVCMSFNLKLKFIPGSLKICIRCVECWGYTKQGGIHIVAVEDIEGAGLCKGTSYSIIFKAIL